MSVSVDHTQFVAPASFVRIQNGALFVGIVGTVASLIGLFVERGAFFNAYLLGFTYWWDLSMGCLALLMLYHLVGGMWGFTMRRPLEAASLNILYVGLLWVPLIFGAGTLYEWMDPNVVRNSPELLHKAGYLNLQAWALRGVIGFVLWGLLAVTLHRWSGRQDKETGSFDWRFQRLCGVGLIIYLLSITWSSVDWVMSLEPHWWSTIYGLMFVPNQALLAVALMVTVGYLLWDYEPMKGLLKHYHFQDWGKLMLTFTMVFGYFQFSQLLVMWSGNLPEEIGWYLHRQRGGWEWVSLAVVLLGFAVPFALLLSKARKRDPKSMVALAALVAVMQYVVLWWMERASAPVGREQINFTWQDLAVWAAMGGWWVALFCRQMRQRPLLVFNDPKMETLLSEHEHEE